jgi:hypothetical protein
LLRNLSLPLRLRSNNEVSLTKSFAFFTAQGQKGCEAVASQPGGKKKAEHCFATIGVACCVEQQRNLPLTCPKVVGQHNGQPSGKKAPLSYCFALSVPLLRNLRTFFGELGRKHPFPLWGKFLWTWRDLRATFGPLANEVSSNLSLSSTQRAPTS